MNINLPSFPLQCLSHFARHFRCHVPLVIFDDKLQLKLLWLCLSFHLPDAMFPFLDSVEKLFQCSIHSDFHCFPLQNNDLSSLRNDYAIKSTHRHFCESFNSFELPQFMEKLPPQSKYNSSPTSDSS